MTLPETGWAGYGKPGVTDPATRDANSRTDQTETRAAAVSGIAAWPDEVALLYEAAVLSHRR